MKSHSYFFRLEQLVFTVFGNITCDRVVAYYISTDILSGEGEPAARGTKDPHGVRASLIGFEKLFHLSVNLPDSDHLIVTEGIKNGGNMTFIGKSPDR